VYIYLYILYELPASCAVVSGCKSFLIRQYDVLNITGLYTLYTNMCYTQTCVCACMYMVRAHIFTYFFFFFKYSRIQKHPWGPCCDTTLTHHTLTRIYPHVQYSWYTLAPMLVCRFTTLIFNVHFHPEVHMRALLSIYIDVDHTIESWTILYIWLIKYVHVSCRIFESRTIYLIHWVTNYILDSCTQCMQHMIEPRTLYESTTIYLSQLYIWVNYIFESCTKYTVWFIYLYVYVCIYMCIYMCIFICISLSIYEYRTMTRVTNYVHQTWHLWFESRTVYTSHELRTSDLTHMIESPFVYSGYESWTTYIRRDTYDLSHELYIRVTNSMYIGHETYDGVTNCIYESTTL